MVGELQSTAILPGSFSAFTGTPGAKHWQTSWAKFTLIIYRTPAMKALFR